MPRIRLLPALALATAPLTGRAQTIAIVNANVVDVRAGRVLARSTVLVDGQRVVALGPTDSVVIPPAARRIDAAGGFLLPGLADMHAHFARPEELTAYLASGVTLVQYLNAFPEMLDWRDSVAAGVTLGPDLHPCMGPIIGIESAAEARRVVADAKADGFDCVKPYDRISPEAFRALVTEARTLRVRTVGHIPRNLTWEEAVQDRPDAIAHAEEFLYSPITGPAAVDSLIRGMRDGGISLVTTLVDYDMITRQVVELPELLQMPGLAYYSPVHRRLWAAPWNRYARAFTTAAIPGMRRLLSFQRTLVKSLDSAGVRILLGTDAGSPLVLPGGSVHDELEQLVLAGLSPAAALRAATIAPAEFLGLDREVGSVEAGKRADLLLIYGNPLSDITTTRLISGVMRAGHWFPRDSLRHLLDTVRARFALEQRFLDAVNRDGIASALAAVARDHYVPDARALNELAYQFWRVQHDTANAHSAFAADVRLHPTDWIAHGSLGEFLAFAGDTTGAVSETRQALQQHPKDRDLRTQLARLEGR